MIFIFIFLVLKVSNPVLALLKSIMMETKAEETISTAEILGW